jgi:tetratricopeptide (TPR) repeat protein
LRDRIAALDPVVAQEVGHIEGGGDADDSAPSLSATGLDITETETDVPDLDLDLDLEVDLDLDDAIDEVAAAETHSGLDFGSGESGPSDDFEIELDDESESLDASETDPMSAPATADVEETAPDLGDPVDEIEFELDDDITFSDEDDEDAEEAAESPTENHLETSGINPERVDEELEEAEFYIAQDMLDEAEGILKRVLEIAPNHPSALLRMGEIAAARGEIEGSGPSPTPELNLDDEGDDTLSAGGSATAPVTVDDEEEISFEVELDLDADDADNAGDADKAGEDDVAVEDPTESDISAGLEVTIEDEDEEFLDVSIEDEDLEIEPEPLAEEPPLAASASVPPPAEEAITDSGPEEASVDLDLDLDVDSEGEATDPIAAAPEEIVSEDEADEPEPVVEEVPEEVAAAAHEPVHQDVADAGETFDLREALSDVLDDDEPLAADSNDTSGVLSTVEDGFASIFSDFKKGVSATLEEGDFDTRYDLGIAYREMGLFDDAIGEFRVCLDSPGRRFDSLYLMGLCARDLTRWDDAVHHLEQALALPEIPEERLAGVYFDLSIAQEGAGDLERACASVERVVELEADFPGAASRLETLRSGGSALPEVGAPGEVYESFDELFDADDDEGGDEGGDQALVESPPVETFESFDDVVSEAEAILEEPNGSEEEGVLAAEIIEEPETAEESHPGDTQSRKSGRKKISFV